MTSMTSDVFSIKCFQFLGCCSEQCTNPHFNFQLSSLKGHEKRQQQRNFQEDYFTQPTIELTQPILSFHGRLGLFCPELETFSVAFSHFDSNPKVKQSLFTFIYVDKKKLKSTGLILLYLPPEVLHEYYSDDEDHPGSKMVD